MYKINWDKAPIWATKVSRNPTGLVWSDRAGYQYTDITHNQSNKLLYDASGTYNRSETILIANRPVDAYTDLRQAYTEGKTIELNMIFSGKGWTAMTDTPAFVFPASQYRIKPVDAFAELKAAYAEGAKIEMCDKFGDNWKYISNPLFDCPDVARYRIKSTKAPHVHAELMNAYAEDTSLELQVYAPSSDTWWDISNPSFDAAIKYRIKPSINIELTKTAIHCLLNAKTDKLKRVSELNKDIAEITGKVDKLEALL